MILKTPSMLCLLTLALATLTLAAPTKWYEKYNNVLSRRVLVPQSYYEVLKMRSQIPLNPRAVRDVTCLDRRSHIVYHDENVAELAICGGIAGGDKTKRCQGKPRETYGRSGTALFSLKAMDAKATINISKQKWEQCVRAAREACPTGSLSGICLGGATSGNVGFTLTGV
ncbi:hypothetical protein QBC35DRAFT_282810 [Podospora australis]|uniref:Ecp2 effector protein domain-containing protein n=1 Tax=Podospora australis TaxID=1536484 RepID=A0AAN6WRJ9_9PEZI|nr:hypothetical protein QBC35DRAFT_282810 [Podospora australis]